MDLSTPENLEITDHLLMTTRSVRKRLNFSPACAACDH